MDRPEQRAALGGSAVAARPPQTGVSLDLQNNSKFLQILYIAPIQLLLIFMLVFPFLLELYLSFTQWQPTFGNWWEAPLVGFSNYIDLIVENERFRGALLRTLFIAVVSLAAEFALGLGLALILVKSFPGKRLIFSLFLVPMMMMPIVVGYDFYMLFQRTGPINQMLGWLVPGDVVIDWLSRPGTALAAIMIAEIWHWTPLFLLIMVSGLAALPPNPLRAAQVLGASDWQIFRYLVLPMLRPMILIAFAIRGMEVIKVFDEVFIMTRGGPGVATETISLYLYQLAFRDFRLGYAAAAAFIVLILTVLVIHRMLKPIEYRLVEER